MKILEDIMAESNLFPVMIDGNKKNPVDRLIFCNILADKYTELRKSGQYGTWNKKSPKTPVSEYLGYAYGHNNSVKYLLRDGAIASIKGYKDYYTRYLLVKAAFSGDERYTQMLEQHEIRDKAQAKATELMKQILNK